MLKIPLFLFGITMKALYTGAKFLDKDFSKRLGQRDITIVIKTRDGQTARTFRLQAGKIFSTGQDHPNPDIALIWSNSQAAILTMLHLTPKSMVNAFCDALMNDKLNITFKMEPFIWASITFTQMLGAYTNWDRRKKVYA